MLGLKEAKKIETAFLNGSFLKKRGGRFLNC
ncbi:hypothetical protein PRJBM_01344 [Bartonella henselae]|uniref:Uncharacterized protein n=1 Tax=Bartonella henselae TaxID=38323 RepID=X5MI80_BARHN|nr:hypothetical protein Q653_01508 [Bartonella henselae JK 42]ETS07447.1 hypothetical protein Q654_01355 [Bartonella henselae JK 50]ETS07765.1 hypothetical protein Q655_01306 [Bartonella henselae JK 51]ETS11134.1 hypothetical protein Q652_01481 [Bartonella henselae JK 41]KEC55913.1 hypothetical protein O97_01448 [Bartonella henselae str. Zeus]KEC58966.1 hypothetical protein O95_01457 [Bartonella henselae JK 53]CDO40698.1 hypothetical protein PRJBM_01344 [Bartonella henselae]